MPLAASTTLLFSLELCFSLVWMFLVMGSLAFLLYQWATSYPSNPGLFCGDCSQDHEMYKLAKFIVPQTSPLATPLKPSPPPVNCIRVNGFSIYLVSQVRNTSLTPPSPSLSASSHQISLIHLSKHFSRTFPALHCHDYGPNHCPFLPRLLWVPPAWCPCFPQSILPPGSQSDILTRQI